MAEASASAYVGCLLLMFMASAKLGGGEEEKVAPGFDREALAAATVVPDWLDAASDPDLRRATLDVTYTFDNATFPVRLGEILPENATKTRPTVRVNVNGTSEGLLLTILMVDPDANPPYQRNVVHWAVSNIPATTISGHYVSQEIWEAGIENVKYVGAYPRAGIHRYYFLVFQQERELNITIEDQYRTNFSVRNFTKTYDLYYPIGGTFFEVSATQSLWIRTSTQSSKHPSFMC